MADVLQFTGSLEANPATGNPSGSQAVIQPFLESLTLIRKLSTSYELDADAPVSVGFDNLAQAQVLAMRATGGKVRARLTSADGSQQSVPVDPAFILFSSSVPLTALDLTRVSGVLTTVEIFLGQTS